MMETYGTQLGKEPVLNDKFLSRAKAVLHGIYLLMKLQSCAIVLLKVPNMAAYTRRRRCILTKYLAEIASTDTIGLLYDLLRKKQCRQEGGPFDTLTLPASLDT